MRCIAAIGRRPAILAALALVLPVGACDTQPVAPATAETRLFRVTQADDQLLPSHRACPAPVDGMVTGTHFVEGELILYPERTFTWRYTIQQYASMQGMQQAWVEPATVQGTYEVDGDALTLFTGATAERTGRIHGDVIGLSESVPCHFVVDGYTHHSVELDLRQVRDEG